MAFTKVRQKVKKLIKKLISVLFSLPHEVGINGLIKVARFDRLRRRRGGCGLCQKWAWAGVKGGAGIEAAVPLQPIYSAPANFSQTRAREDDFSNN